MRFAAMPLAVTAAVLLAGCVVRQQPAAVDVHREWWGQHHPRETYDPYRADREHREWCARTPDRTCEGWR